MRGPSADPFALRPGARYLLVQAPALHPVALYVLVPPFGGKLRVSPPNGTAITTNFKLETYGWSTDAFVASTSTPPLSAAMDWLAATAPLPPPAAAAAFAVEAGALSVQAASAVVSTANGLAGAEAQDDVTESGLPPPSRLVTAWQLAAMALGGAGSWAPPVCVFSDALGCWSVPSSTVAAASVARLGTQLASFSATGSPIAAQSASTVVKLRQLTYAFSADATGAFGESSNASALLSDPAGFAAQLEQLSDGRSHWPGVPLAAQAASAMLLTALPQGPTESNYSVQIFAIVEDAFGHVQVASASVTVLPWPLAGNAAAVSGLVTSQLASLANVTDGLSALSTVSSLGALMQGASSATLNASSVPPDVIETSAVTSAWDT